MDVNIVPNTGNQTIYNKFNNYLANSTSRNAIIIISITIILLYIILFSNISYGTTSIVPSNTTTPWSLWTPTVTPLSPNFSSQSINYSLNFFEIIMWGLFVFLILIQGLQYFYGFDISTSLRNLFKGTPQIDVILSPEQELEIRKKKAAIAEEDKEVFHVKQNTYNYKQAKAVCKALDSELATYDQVRKAFNKGAEWCGYGWSDDQMALFPTQMKTWKKLQKNKNHKNDCGRPGINGGYIVNPYVKFGVNCYGAKRNPTDFELNLMEAKQKQPFPPTKEEKRFNKMVNKYKKKLDKISLNPFNQEKWNQI